MDRNIKQMNERGYGVESLSARRAWIEIEAFVSDFKTFFVSLSARRAWIEMFLSMGLDGRFKSLSARRAWIEIVHRGPYHFYLGRRSPQGERG